MKTSYVLIWWVLFGALVLSGVACKSPDHKHSHVSYASQSSDSCLTGPAAFRSVLDEYGLGEALPQLSGQRFDFTIRGEAGAPSFYTIADDYLSLQEFIADKVPEESKRPVINIRIEIAGEGEPKKIGILGGTGPLSDAHLLKSLIHEQKLQSNSGLVIDLLSIPPPREVSLESLKKAPRYLSNISNFLNQGYDRYFLASNTAHLNLSKVRGLKSLRGNTPKSKVVNLVKQTIFHIDKMAVKPDEFLILGTHQAWESELYASRLQGMKKKGEIKSQALNFKDLDEAQSLQLQGYINEIKSGALKPGSKKAQLFAETLADWASQAGVKGLILSCTEIPLGLHGKPIEHLRQSGFTVIDTESTFAAAIAEQVKSLDLD